jgi:phosphatidylserine decarboxylase
MIHREGYRIILTTVLLLAAVNILCALFLGTGMYFYILNTASVLLIVFILRFFRNPKRKPYDDPRTAFAPADGKVVVVEETTEQEYFGDPSIQVSIFMSVWNVHINWYPVAGRIVLARYHPGKYLVARHPKSSTLNEHFTCVIRTAGGMDLLVRQIAGAVARRIISYPVEGKDVLHGEELGFIRFGSRVDIFFPPGTEILVKPGQRVRGLQTPVARIK